MALTLDKIKILIPGECVETWTWAQDIFKSESLNLPYHLYIKRNRLKNEYTVEFSGKILLDRYPELINIDNIGYCISRINSLGFCRFNIERTIEYGNVKGVDITKDVRISDIPNANTMDDIKSIVRLSIGNYRRWTYQDYSQNGIVVCNTVQDARYRRRLTIYDKRRELDLRRNSNFLDALTNSQNVLDYYNGRVRIELRGTTLYQLRRWFNIEDLRLSNVLSSPENPLLTVMQEMFIPIYAIGGDVAQGLRTQDRFGFLKSMDWDLMRVEAHVREHTTRSITESMRPYRELYAIHHHISQDVNIVDIVR